MTSYLVCTCYVKTLMWRLSNEYNDIILFMYKFLRDVANFRVFRINRSAAAKFSSSKFHWQNFGLHQLESKIHVNDYKFDTCKRWWHVLILPAAATEVVLNVVATSLRLYTYAFQFILSSPNIDTSNIDFW